MFFVCSAMLRCYNFGPTFRADSSSDRTHLAEFYMVEAEVAFTHSIEDILQVSTVPFCHLLSEGFFKG